jgi:hypothetical protein
VPRSWQITPKADASDVQVVVARVKGEWKTMDGRTASKHELWAVEMPTDIQRDLITWGPPIQVLGLVGASIGSFLTASVLWGALQRLGQTLIGRFRKDRPPRRPLRRPRDRS